MIVPMKKMTLFMSARDKGEALQKLRQLGVLHVEHMTPPQSSDIDSLTAEVAKAEKALILLDEAVPSEKAKTSNGKKALDTLLALVSEREEVSNALEKKLEARTWFDRWGSVSLSDILSLEEAGVYIHLYRTDANTIKKLPEDQNVVVLAEEKGIVFAALLSRDIDERLDIVEDIMPQVDVNELDNEIQSLQQKLSTLEKDWTAMADDKPAIEAYLTELRHDLEFQNVMAGMGDEAQIVLMQGFCPTDALVDLKQAADQHGWGYVIEEPDNPMDVPTLLKNPKPLRIIEPLFKFMGTLPGYHEVDVSFIFLVFFSIFYAMIIGDAGYGLIFLGGTIYARIKNRKAPIEPFALFFILSITTIVWGTLTGTWFGSKEIVAWAPLRGLVIENMFSFNNSTESTRFMMKFSFILGLIHLVLGRIMAFVKQLPSIKSIAQLGWAAIVVGIFFVADLLVLSNPLPAFVLPLILGGLIIVGIFTNFTPNPLKLIGSFLGTVANSILDVISGFSDVVSYIRLFAVGIASVTVAASFNQMASGIMAPLVLVFGHGLNIILGLMSVMVHGVRLNMLEFSGHLGQEWTGKEYQPFAEKRS